MAIEGIAEQIVGDRITHSEVSIDRQINLNRYPATIYIWLSQNLRQSQIVDESKLPWPVRYYRFTVDEYEDAGKFAITVPIALHSD